MRGQGREEKQVAKRRKERDTMPMDFEEKQRTNGTNKRTNDNNDLTSGDSSDEDDSAEISSDDEGSSWITWYCKMKGNEFYCEVDEDFISDDFNLTGLRSLVPHFDSALDVILDNDSGSYSVVENRKLNTLPTVTICPTDIHSDEHQKTIDSAAETLYGLIHARFILTNRGLLAMVPFISSCRKSLRSRFPIFTAITPCPFCSCSSLQSLFTDYLCEQI